jgi:YesN/AraC family two-component response regulator
MTSDHIRHPLVGKRIVIIEDEVLILLAFQRTCQKEGMIVVGTADNGRDGVELVLRERPDIVLTDIVMPVMNGLEAARLILAQLRVCLVFVTALSDDETRTAIAHLGGHGIIAKPASHDALVCSLEQAYRHFQLS